MNRRLYTKSKVWINLDEWCIKWSIICTAFLSIAKVKYILLKL